jgi:hypothetical protein
MEYYLDAAPMIRSLSDNPSEFEMDHDGIRHRPSRHWLRFDVDGNAELMARCNCVELPISRQQSEELRVAVAAWQHTYWRPLMAREAAERRVAEINRAFAEHSGRAASCAARSTLFWPLSGSTIEPHSTASIPHYPRTRNCSLGWRRRHQDRSVKPCFRPDQKRGRAFGHATPGYRRYCKRGDNDAVRWHGLRSADRSRYGLLPDMEQTRLSPLARNTVRPGEAGKRRGASPHAFYFGSQRRNRAIAGGCEGIDRRPEQLDAGQIQVISRTVLRRRGASRSFDALERLRPGWVGP